MALIPFVTYRLFLKMLSTVVSRAILQDGQEWPFLKQTYTQTLTIGTRQYSFPADMASVDWGTFYLKKLTSANNQPKRLSPISYEEYISRFRQADDNANQLQETLHQSMCIRHKNLSLVLHQFQIRHIK